MKIVALILCLLISMNLFAVASAAGIPKTPDMKNIKITKILYSDNQVENYFSNGKKVAVYIPRISGMTDHTLQNRINDNLRDYILSRKNIFPESTLRGNFEVSFYNGNLLGIHFIGLSYSKGAAHPNKIDVGIHVDLNTGEIYRFKDLFKDGIDYKERIKELCRQNDSKYRLAIYGHWNDWTYDDFSISWTEESFLLAADSVRVYDSLNFASGYYSGYRIPYMDMIQIIDTDGRFYKSIVSRKPATIQVIPE